MSDFHQTGAIATFHRLGRPSLEHIESELKAFSGERPIALVLPSLITELEGEALKGIVEQLKEVEYVAEIIVTLGPCNADQYKYAREFFSVLPQKTRVIWNYGERISDIYRSIEDAGLPVGMDGKGRSAWMAYGYVLSRREFRVIALHDCDILTYSRDLLARLCYPVANPNLDYQFCKGYYSRVTDRLHGRVTRLLFSPLIKALQKIVGYIPLLVYFDSFRYTLSGEFSMSTDLSRVIRIPGDWGLEVGVLAEVYRNSAFRRICQVDIAENYDHKHQKLLPDDPTTGLLKMCVDICKSLFRTLVSEGVIFNEGFVKTMVASYVHAAEDMLKRFEDDAAINGLYFYRHAETLAVETFVKGIEIAADAITRDPLGVPLIPSWDRVTSAIPDMLDRIGEAVEEDNK